MELDSQATKTEPLASGIRGGKIFR